MLGIIIGVVFGAAQFYLLLIGVRSVGSEKVRILPLLVQFFCPFLGLLLCAFLDRAHLLVCAIIIIGILVVGAIVNTLVYLSRTRGNRRK